MSIIQEALKKAQGDYAVKKAPREKACPATEELPKKEPSHLHEPVTHTHDRKYPSVRLPALISVLVILLLVYGLRASLQYTRSHEKPLAPARAAAGESAMPAKKTVEAAPESVFSQTAKLDPINFMGPRQSLFVLNGIMYIDGKPQAIINGQVLQEGDRISGATVLAIEKDCVLLDLNDTNIRLDIKK
jgi:hypothetical protein